MSEQSPSLYWYCGVYDDQGLDYFEPGTKENALFAIRRADGLSFRNAKAFLVQIPLETEHTLLELIQIGEIQYAKLIVESCEGVKYVA